MCILHSPLGRSFLNIYIKQYVSYKPVQLKNMRQNIRNRHHSYFLLCCTFYQSLVLVWVLIKDVISVRAFEITLDMPKGVTLRNVINNVIWVNKTRTCIYRWDREHVTPWPNVNFRICRIRHCEMFIIFWFWKDAQTFDFYQSFLRKNDKPFNFTLTYTEVRITSYLHTVKWSVKMQTDKFTNIKVL